MACPFLGVYTASYAYTPQGEGELALEEGDLLYVLERSDDDWWKVKKKVNNSDDDEPVGLVPATYIEEVSFLVHLDIMSAERGSLRKSPHYRSL